MQSNMIFMLVVAVVALASPVSAFGAGFVPRGSSSKGFNYRHGDILYAVYFLQNAHSSLVQQIYFGNWLRDFSQLMDRKAMEVVPEPILRALVAIFAYLQFGYTTKEFEVTQERLGYYRPEEHVDNPLGYEGGVHTQLRPSVTPQELSIDTASGMKNYICNSSVANANETSRAYIDRQLVAAIACGRARDPEAYTHLGAALHALEDFVAHSNWLELCLQILSAEMGGTSPEMSPMRDVFAFTGGAASTDTVRGRAPPLVTGTFGSLDLYQTILGEFDDKLSSLSLSGLQMRMKSSDESLSSVSKLLISTFDKLDNNDFASDITSVTKSATETAADWGRLNEAPELLWQQLYPVFRLRDKIVRWVYDHLTVDAVANAVASISTALDKLVYRIIGTFLGPALQDLSRALSAHSDHLLAEDEKMRLARGSKSVFDKDSTATDPTHSQLCKDHYDHELNELAGRVASKITTYTIKKIIEVWQPGSEADVQTTLDNILETIHHPYNYSKSSEIQSLMVAEVLNWCTTNQQEDPEQFAVLLQQLDRDHMAQKLGEQLTEKMHSHVPSMTAAYASSNQISGTTAHDLTTINEGGAGVQFLEKIKHNLEKAATANKFPDLTPSALEGITKTLFSAPSADAPNPIDSSLVTIPGAGLLSVFDDIDVGEIVAAPGMGIVLKDAVIAMRLKDTEWVERQQVAARERLGQLEDRPVKEMLQLLDFGAKDKKAASEDEEVGGEREQSKASKLMSKLKIGKSRDS